MYLNQADFVYQESKISYKVANKSQRYGHVKAFYAMKLAFVSVKALLQAFKVQTIAFDTLCILKISPYFWNICLKIMRTASFWPVLFGFSEKITFYLT